MQEQGIVGRFAPSPSGVLHLGNMACALMAYVSVRSRGGKFLLRIEDLDRPRCPEKWAWQAMRDLEKLGITWDEEPVWQSKREEAYEAAFARLESMGLLYPCFCTRAEIMAVSRAPNLGDTQRVYPGTCARLTERERETRMRHERFAWRIRVRDESISFHDRVRGIYTENLQHDCGDFVIRRTDGLFAYQLAVVVDDTESGVTEVVRGRDLLSVTPRQIYLQKCLGLAPVTYAHIPLMCDRQGRRLAKRDRDLSFASVMERLGPDGVRGMLAHATGLISENTPVSMEEVIRCMDWKRVPITDVCLPL